MITLRSIENPEEKERITLTVMNALPQWFSPPEDIVNKAKIHREYPFFAAFDKEEAVGFAVLKIQNPYTIDIFNMGVLTAHHRTGTGTELVRMCENYGREHGYRYLTVKTLDESADYEPYEATRAFYQKNGFIPLEVFLTVWDEDNPCLFLAKCLG